MRSNARESGDLASPRLGSLGKMRKHITAERHRGSCRRRPPRSRPRDEFRSAAGTTRYRPVGVRLLGRKAGPPPCRRQRVHMHFHAFDVPLGVAVQPRIDWPSAPHRRSSSSTISRRGRAKVERLGTCDAYFLPYLAHHRRCPDSRDGSGPATKLGLRQHEVLLPVRGPCTAFGPSGGRSSSPPMRPRTGVIQSGCGAAEYRQ